MIGLKPDPGLGVVVVVVVDVVKIWGMMAAPNEPRTIPIGKSAIISVLPSLVEVELNSSGRQNFGEKLLGLTIEFIVDI